MKKRLTIICGIIALLVAIFFIFRVSIETTIASFLVKQYVSDDTVVTPTPITLDNYISLSGSTYIFMDTVYRVPFTNITQQDTGEGYIRLIGDKQVVTFFELTNTTALLYDSGFLQTLQGELNSNEKKLYQEIFDTLISDGNYTLYKRVAEMTPSDINLLDSTKEKTTEMILLLFKHMAIPTRASAISEFEYNNFRGFIVTYSDKPEQNIVVLFTPEDKEYLMLTTRLSDFELHAVIRSLKLK
jgi:hypothetical protein